MAWHFLTQDQQDKANKKADEAILKWEIMHSKKLEQLLLF